MRFIAYFLSGMVFGLFVSPVCAATGASPRVAPSVTALRIPLRQAATDGLQALLVRPAGEGPFPLVVLTHGKAATLAQNKAQRPEDLLPLAEPFVRRGWAVGIVMRRGYGSSGGRFEENMYSCTYPDDLHAAREAAHDLSDAIRFLSQQQKIDGTRVIAIGGSMGGLAVVALTADPPPGLIAAINFSGVMGHVAPDTVCQPGTLLSTFWLLGKKSRLPMLWVYAENDHFIPLPLARQCYQEFTQAGGNATFIAAPQFGKEGHFLFSKSGITQWTPLVDAFFKQHHF